MRLDLSLLKLMCILAPVAACGYGADDETVIRKKPKPSPGAITWEDVAPLVETSCGGCHGEGKPQAAIDSRDRLVASQPRIANDSMPPGGGLDGDVKAKLLGVE